MSTAYLYINNTGVISPDTSTIQDEVIAEYKSLFGSALNVDPNTPQGILITSETAARTAVATNNAQLANQINPDLSGGVYLDALLALTGSFRISATPSLVYATVSGVAGTVIAAGSRAQETNNLAIFETTQQIVIPAAGVIYGVEFQSLIDGAIPCLAGSLTQIITDIEGWESVDNPENGNEGNAQQSDASARNLRKVTLAAQGTSVGEAITSALYLTSGVTSLTYQENYQSSTQVINSVSMAPNSLYTCVAGTASSIDIATTLTATKGGGCAYNNGNGIQVQQIVTPTYSNQNILVLFDRPSILSISMRINVNSLSTVTDIKTAVKNAVLAYAAGEIEYMPGFVVGSPVSPLQISAAISYQIPGIFINSLVVAVINFTQQGTTIAGSGVVTGMTYTSSITVGMQVSGTGIPEGTLVQTINNANSITLSNLATVSTKQTLSFGVNPNYQAIEIPLEVWQQAATSTSYIVVTSS